MMPLFLTTRYQRTEFTCFYHVLHLYMEGLLVVRSRGGLGLYLVFPLQVALKIIKHCKECMPALVTGQLLGLDIGSILEVTNCFPFPVSFQRSCSFSSQAPNGCKLESDGLLWHVECSIPRYLYHMGHIYSLCPCYRRFK